MKQRIHAVQRLFWTTLVLAIGLLAANATGGNNGPAMAALVELKGFAANFDRQALEQTLLEHARAQARLPLSRITKGAASAPGVPDLSAADEHLEPSGEVSLATLGDLYAHRDVSETRMGVPSLEDLRGGLAFRLARQAATKKHTLIRVELLPAGANTADVDAFRKAEAARNEAIEARKRYARAEQKFTRLDELLTQRRKWRANRKVIRRTLENRGEALQERNRLRAELDEASDRYQTLADAADAYQGEPNDPREADTAAALAKLTLEVDGDSVLLRIPVALEYVQVTLPAMEGVSFEETRAAGLWPRVEDKTPDAAVAVARQDFGWHYRYAQVGPVKLGGMTVLQLWPLCFPVLLWLLYRKVRSVSDSYDPYAAADVDLPKVGARQPLLDGLVLVGVPALACAWSGYALMQIDQLPVIAMTCTPAVLILGTFATRELKELRSFEAAVIASHSHPPAPPSNPAG